MFQVQAPGWYALILKIYQWFFYYVVKRYHLDTGCVAPNFGRNCEQQCHCQNGGCNHVNGRCSSPECQSGWSGPSCDHRMCYYIIYAVLWSKVKKIIWFVFIFFFNFVVDVKKNCTNTLFICIIHMRVVVVLFIFVSICSSNNGICICVSLLTF